MDLPMRSPLQKGFCFEMLPNVYIYLRECRSSSHVCAAYDRDITSCNSKPWVNLFNENSSLVNIFRWSLTLLYSNCETIRDIGPRLVLMLSAVEIGSTTFWLFF